MGLRINYNGAAANAWRNLGVNDSKLSGSVEKLSSGLRINKGADDPAGLIISERLKSQITGLGQAIQNAQEATSLVQTAEGALTEMNNMLNKMRGLAVHAANTGVNDADAIAADQRQVDSALDSLQKIAENTKYQQKTLLDGSAGNVASYDSATTSYGNSYSSIDVKGNISNITGAADLEITTQAERATVSGTGNFASSSSARTLTVTAGGTSTDFTIGATDDLATTVSKINNFFDDTGVWASANGTNLQLTYSAFGSASTITAHTGSSGILAATSGDSIFDQGVDADGTLTVDVAGTGSVTLGMSGTGLSLTVDSTESYMAGTQVDLMGANTAATTSERAGAAGTDVRGNNVGVVTDLFQIEAGALSFSLGQDASASEIRSLEIDNMQVDQLGKISTLTGSSLNSLRTAGSYALATDAANAVKIIDAAIDDVSIARANLGAFQQNALETTISTLSINKENLEASNSRIRDVDMAQEMMSFTKAQILSQAGTAMLAQANQLPQSVLQLLG